jgi:hypothetical protein
MTKTLSEKISNLRKISEQILEWPFSPNSESYKMHDIGEAAAAKQAMEIIEQLQAENQALLAKNGELEKANKWREKQIMRDHERKTQLKAENDDLEAKVKELEGKGWLPIESAPKDRDSVSILVFCGDLGFERKTVEIENSINWKWYKDNGFTHWMPLPLPPKPTNPEE